MKTIAIDFETANPKPGNACQIGLAWIVGRILYMIGYAQAANKRSTGFIIQASAALILWLGALGTILWRAVHG